ncbi:MAG: aminopeptidase [Solirubrobacterales bacterium]|nr:aminopeptidase [Solirubrobacterales bacterium]
MAIPQTNQERLTALAELTVNFAANVQPGQVLAIGAELGKEDLVRALADAGYRAGAKFVDVSWFDPHIKHSRIAHADPESLGWVPPWIGQRVLALGDQQAARIGLTGPVEPHLFDDLDPALVGRDQLPFVAENGTVVSDRTTNWTAIPCPTSGWAELCFPDMDPEAALERLWTEIAHVCRLDEEDPVAAWAKRMDLLEAVGQRLGAMQPDALRLRGPGTDLEVGLLPTSKWIAARFSRADGLVHMANMPSEEIFTTPDPQRVNGVVRSTKPLVAAGTVIEGLEVEFEAGRIVRIDADQGAGALRAMAERDEGASRLGEIALVDGGGRIGPLEHPFYDTLLDENAASHIAIGSAYLFAVDEVDYPRANKSGIHVDFMIGSNEVETFAVSADGTETLVLANGEWKI